MLHEIPVIEAGRLILFSSPDMADFKVSNCLAHAFGPEAKTQGQSPITLRVNFIDGNSVKFRGDLKTPYVNIMVFNLSELLKYYMKLNKVDNATMYDNRPQAFNTVILEYKEKEIKQNFLPLYINNYKLKTLAKTS